MPTGTGAQGRGARPAAIALAIALAIVGLAFWLGRGGPPLAPRPPIAPDTDGGGAADPVPPPPDANGDDAPLPAIPDGPRIAAGGRVIDTVTGRGVAGATVTVSAGRDVRTPPLASARTDPGGFFACEVPERDALGFAVRAEGYAPARWSLEGGFTPSGIPLEIGDLELEVAPESALVIRSDFPGLPADERVVVEVSLRQARTAAELGEPIAARGNEALFGGAGRVGGLATGRYLVSFRTSRQRLGSLEVELGMGEERLVEFSLGPPVAIHGTVRYDGRPVGGGRLVIWGRDHASHTAAVVGGRGEYSVTLPEAGSYAFAFTPSRRDADAGPGGSAELAIVTPGRYDIDFRSARIEGIVVGPRGEPAGDLPGTLLGPQALSFVTDAGGRFAIEGAPHGDYRWLFPAPPPGCFAPPAELSVAADTTARYDFEPALELEVRVRSEAAGIGEVGTPQVGLLGPGGEVTPLRPTDRPDRYWWPERGGLVVVRKRGFAPWFADVPPTTSPAPLFAALEPGGELTVTLFDDAGEALGGHPFRIDPIAATRLPEEWCARATGPRGAAVLELPVGIYRVSATIDGFPATREVRVHERAPTEVRLP